MRKSNFALRLQPSLLDEARKLAEQEGVSLNQLINVAVAEELSHAGKEPSPALSECPGQHRRPQRHQQWIPQFVGLSLRSAGFEAGRAGSASWCRDGILHRRTCNTRAPARPRRCHRIRETPR